jgi:hypothetical protein
MGASRAKYQAPLAATLEALPLDAGGVGSDEAVVCAFSARAANLISVFPKSKIDTTFFIKASPKKLIWVPNPSAALPRVL